MYGISQFPGPVMVVTGERDLPFCGGDCYVTGEPSVSSVSSIPATAKDFLPKAKNVNITIVPGGGHALNLECGHANVYHVMNDFLGNNGLAATKQGKL